MTNKNTFKKTYPHFYERQRYKNPVLLILVILIELVLFYYILRQVLDDKLWGSGRFDSWLLIASTILVPTPLLLSFFLVRLDTIITEEGIFYRWAPFNKNYQMILWTNIKEVFMIEMKDKGLRWRFTHRYEESHFPGSEYALVIQMRSGKKKLLGTRKAIEMNRMLIRNSGNRYNSVFVEKFDFD